MGLVDGTISSLIQGVSQQPARERLKGQVESQENCTSDPVTGVRPRGATEWIDELVSSADTYTAAHHYGDDSGNFVILYKSGEIKVFDVDGTENTVTVDSGADSYIPASGLEFIGIDDDIYLVDTAVTTAMLSGTRTYQDHGSLFFLLGGQYGREYSVTLNWKDAAETEYSQTYTYTTPNGSSASHINLIATDAIAESLVTGLVAITEINDDFDITRQDDVVYIERKTGADVATYSISVSDGDGGANMFAVNNKVDDVGDLPRYAPQGYLVAVEENATSDADNWYLEFVLDEGDEVVGDGFGSAGKWVETVSPDVDYQLDPSTMPHMLEKTGPSAFTLKQVEWEDRAVGDDSTNPLPSFIGHAINDMEAFQGRLVLLADVNLVTSRTDKPNNFFKQSATTTNDDDPIDVKSKLGSFVLKQAVPHNRDLLVFGDTAQFILFGRNAITPDNTSLVLTTEFETSLEANPVSAGRNVFLSFDIGQFTGIHEYFTEGSQDINDSRQITQHVSKYIKGSATKMAGTTNFNKLLVQTDSTDTDLYLYEYIWDNSQKVQSAWSKWSFSRDVVHFFFLGNLLYLVMKDGNSYGLFKLVVDDVEDDGVGYRVTLDDKYKESSVDTTLTLPYDVDDINNYVAVQGEGCPYPGLRVSIDSISGDTVTLSESMASGEVIFGRRYSRSIEPTMPFLRDREGVKIDSGSLTIKYFVVYFLDTGEFCANITDDYGYEVNVEYSGRVLGSPNNLIGQPSVSDGNFRVPFKKNTDNSQLKLESNSHLPFAFTEIGWVGSWKKKGRRTTGG